MIKDVTLAKVSRNSHPEKHVSRTYTPASYHIPPGQSGEAAGGRTKDENEKQGEESGI